MLSIAGVRSSAGSRPELLFPGLTGPPLPRIGRDDSLSAGARAVRPFVTFLDSQGIPWESGFARWGLVDDPTRADARFDIHGILRFVDDTARRHAIPELGARVATESPSDPVEPTMRARIQAAPSLLDALRAVRELVHRQSPTLCIWFQLTPDELWVCHRSAIASGFAGRRHFDVDRTLRIIDLVRQFSSPDWTPRALAFLSLENVGPVTRDCVGDCPMVEGLGCGIVPVPRSILVRSQRAPRTEDPDSPLTSLLRAWIAGRLAHPLGPPGIQEAARTLGVTERTLQRRLRRVGLRYRELVARTRLDEAGRLLMDTDLSVARVARLSGYTDPANFHRAYRNTVGHTPGALRALEATPALYS